MEEHGMDSKPVKAEKEYRRFVWSRILFSLLITIVLIWAAVYFADRFFPIKEAASSPSAGQTQTAAAVQQTEPARASHTDGSDHAGQTARTDKDTHAEPSAQPAEEPAKKAPASHAAETPSKAAPQEHAAAGEPGEQAHEMARGVYFMDRLIEPLEYEIKERFYGWRPNDVINFTDNVNELQLGVLETTRRATVSLTERISRRGSAEALDPNLENAMNWLMVNPKNYWFPSPEDKYADALAELRAYQKRLEEGRAGFYTRADNLIPLLKAFEELLGSCDDNLVKLTEEDGDPVSTFSADNYFYYAKGVAKAMTSILHGVEHEFMGTLEVRGGVDVMDHAIHSCHVAAELDPWLWVTEGSLNGILANHRANMAAHISHARFYVSLLVETLST